MANYLFGLLLRPFGLTLTLQDLFGWLNAPAAWLMGVPSKDCVAIGRIPWRTHRSRSEFFGYLSLTQQKATLDPRSFVLATYALCGFANFGSIAIQIGGIGALAPERRGGLGSTRAASHDRRFAGLVFDSRPGRNPDLTIGPGESERHHQSLFNRPAGGRTGPGPLGWASRRTPPPRAKLPFAQTIICLIKAGLPCVMRSSSGFVLCC